MGRPSSTSRAAGRGPWVALGWGVLLSSCSGAHEPRRVPAPEIVPAHVAPTADVPALLGASIDGLRQQLGTPLPLPANLLHDAAIAGLGATVHSPDSVAAFRTGGLVLLASYDARSRQVRDLLLLGQHEDSLMGRARLRTSAADYLVMPVFHTGHSFRLLGLRVISTK
jgi:hypothetical protein